MQTLTGTEQVASLRDTPRAAEQPGVQSASRAACGEPAVHQGLHGGHTRPLLKTGNAPTRDARGHEHGHNATQARVPQDKDRPGPRRTRCPGPLRTRRPGPSERLEAAQLV